MKKLPTPLRWLILGYLVLAIGYAISIPPWEAPDSIWHYHFAAHLADGHGLPTRADEGTDASWRQQGSQPPLYYLLSAPIIALINPQDSAEAIRDNPHAAVGRFGPEGNINRMLHSPEFVSSNNAPGDPQSGTLLAARLVSLFGILLGLIALLATWGLANAAFPERPAIALLATGLQAFNPEFLFFSGAISNDIMITVAGALVLWRSALLLHHGATRRNCIWLGVALGLALLSKLSGVWLLPTAGLALLISARQRTEGIEPAMLGSLIRLSFWTGLPVLAVAGWWYIRNWILFEDPTGLPLMLNVMTPRAQPPGLDELSRLMYDVWRSYWAVFGWFNLPAPSWVYVLLNLFGLFALAGLAFAWRKADLGAENKRQLLLCAAAAASMIIALILWAQLRYPQGRLFFPAAPALSLLLAAGIILPFSNRDETNIARSISLAFATLSLLLLFGVIRPAYQAQGPLNFQAEAASADEALPEPLAVFGDRLAVYDLPEGSADKVMAFGRSNAPGARIGLGLGLPPAKASRGISGLGSLGDKLQLKAGDILQLNLGWRPLRTLEADYSVFLHLMDENGTILAQRDSMPQSGMAPTRGWSPADLAEDEFIPDAQILEIPTHAAALPCKCQLLLGLYDPNTGERLTTGDGDEFLKLGGLELLPSHGEDGVPNPLDIAFGRDVRLAGFSLSRRAAKPGETIALTLYWKTRRRLKTDYKVSVQLRKGDAETWAQRDEEPADGERDTDTWNPGEIIGDLQPLMIYPEAPPGAYTLYVKMYDPDSGEALPVELRHPELDLGAFRILPGG